MKHILEKIKERELKTGLKICENPYTLGASVIDTTTGKAVFTGDNISCQVFVQKLYNTINDNLPKTNF